MWCIAIRYKKFCHHLPADAGVLTSPDVMLFHIQTHINIHKHKPQHGECLSCPCKTFLHADSWCKLKPSVFIPMFARQLCPSACSCGMGERSYFFLRTGRNGYKQNKNLSKTFLHIFTVPVVRSSTGTAKSHSCAPSRPLSTSLYQHGKHPALPLNFATDS